MTTSDTIRATPGLKESDILFTAGTTIRIEAPAQHVFKVITDLNSYQAWNRDTPSMVLKDSSSPLQKGSHIDMKINMTQQNRSYDVPIQILQYEDTPETGGKYVLAWRGNLMPSWVATSERVQEVKPCADDPAHACEVDNFESMAGWGAYVLKYAMGIPAQMAEFNARYLQDLKARAEETRS